MIEGSLLKKPLSISPLMLPLVASLVYMIAFRMDSPTETFITSAGIRLTTLKHSGFEPEIDTF